MKKRWWIRRPSLGDVTASELEYADDVGLLDWTADQASERVSALASGSSTPASMDILAPKPSGMHVHIRERLPVSTEVEALDLPTAGPNARGLFRRHADRRCAELASVARSAPCLPPGQLADSAVKLAKRKASAALLPPVGLVMEGESLESVHQFSYIGCRFTSDEDDVTA